MMRSKYLPANFHNSLLFLFCSCSVSEDKWVLIQCFHLSGWPYRGYLGEHEHWCWLCLRKFFGHHHLPTVPKLHMFTTWHLLDLYRTPHFGKIDKQSLSSSKVYNRFLLAECEHSQVEEVKHVLFLLRI